jgi:hypothetical protein
MGCSTWQTRAGAVGLDEIYLGKKQKFTTVVSNLETARPLWFGRGRKRETLDDFFEAELKPHQRMRITAACIDMWLPFRQSIECWAPNCGIVYDKFHIMQLASRAIDEVRRAEFFRKGARMRGLVKGYALAAVNALGESDGREPAGTEPAVRHQPKTVQGLSAERKPGPPLDLAV